MSITCKIIKRDIRINILTNVKENRLDIIGSFPLNDNKKHMNIVAGRVLRFLMCYSELSPKKQVFTVTNRGIVPIYIICLII